MKNSNERRQGNAYKMFLIFPPLCCLELLSLVRNVVGDPALSIFA